MLNSKNTLNLTLAALLLGASILLPTSHVIASTNKQHKFIYRTSDPSPAGTFEFSSTSPTYEEAYDQAALACYKHYRDYIKTKNSQKHLKEDQGLDIIDVCANPRSS